MVSRILAFLLGAMAIFSLLLSTVTGDSFASSISGSQTGAKSAPTALASPVTFHLTLDNDPTTVDALSFQLVTASPTVRVHLLDAQGKDVGGGWIACTATQTNVHCPAVGQFFHVPLHIVADVQVNTP